MAMILALAWVEIIAPTTPIDTIAVTQHAAYKNGKPPEYTVFFITQCSGFTDAGYFFSHWTTINLVTVGQDKRCKKRDGQSTGKVTEKNQPPVSQQTIHITSGSLIDKRQRHECEYTGQQVKLHQVQHNETDRE